MESKETQGGGTEATQQTSVGGDPERDDCGDMRG